MTQTAVAPQKLSSIITEVSNVIIASTRDTFSTMMDVTVERKSVKIVDRNMPLKGVTSVIALTGSLHGTICLSMTKETTLAMANRMMGMDFTEVDELVASSVSEFANIIAGSSSVALAGMELDLGLPSIIRGSDCLIDFPALAQPLCVTYDSELGPFILIFGFTAKS